MEAAMNKVGLMDKELDQVNGAGFWDDLLDFVEDTVDTLTCKPNDRMRRTVEEYTNPPRKPGEIRDPYENYVPPFPM